jgi:hypothetical protein
MGALETGGAAITGTIDALKSHPTSLALIVINVIFLLGTGYMLVNIMDRVNAANIRHDAMLTSIMQSCGKS